MMLGTTNIKFSRNMLLSVHFNMQCCFGRLTVGVCTNTHAAMSHKTADCKPVSCPFTVVCLVFSAKPLLTGTHTCCLITSPGFASQAACWYYLFLVLVVSHPLTLIFGVPYLPQTFPNPADLYFVSRSISRC